jgi:hypothetical protein
MNKKKIFLGIGATIFFVAGILAGRTAKKFTVSGLYFTSPGTTCTKLLTCAPVAGLFSTTSGGFQAQLNTAGASRTKISLYENSACTDKVYFTNL